MQSWSMSHKIRKQFSNVLLLFLTNSNFTFSCSPLKNNSSILFFVICSFHPNQIPILLQFVVILFRKARILKKFAWFIMHSRDWYIWAVLRLYFKLIILFIISSLLCEIPIWCRIERSTIWVNTSSFAFSDYLHILATSLKHVLQDKRSWFSIDVKIFNLWHTFNPDISLLYSNMATS
ncbi:hypothetical protein DMUE_3674 [Dictyocoela muelleri]|nr:hypothetical protein DMUE_3674 [Dictyocoela muelleri]